MKIDLEKEVTVENAGYAAAPPSSGLPGRDLPSGGATVDLHNGLDFGMRSTAGGPMIAKKHTDNNPGVKCIREGRYASLCTMFARRPHSTARFVEASFNRCRVHMLILTCQNRTGT